MNSYFHYEKGVISFVLNKESEAVKFFNKAIEIFPNYYDAIVYKGR